MCKNNSEDTQQVCTSYPEWEKVSHNWDFTHLQLSIENYSLQSLPLFVNISNFATFDW